MGKSGSWRFLPFVRRVMCRIGIHGPYSYVRVPTYNRGRKVGEPASYIVVLDVCKKCGERFSR
jgi:hypothetical protein